MEKRRHEGFVLADTFGTNRISDHPIPFDHEGAPRTFVDEGELDFGLIALRPNYVRLLAANGVVALEEKNWIHQSNVTFDGYAMTGFPSEFTSERLDEDGQGIVSPTLFAISRLTAPPADLPPTTYPRFVGQIDSPCPFKAQMA